MEENRKESIQFPNFSYIDHLHCHSKGKAFFLNKNMKSNAETKI